MDKSLVFKQVIKNLKDNGIKDITTEVCTLKTSGKTIKFKFYRPDQWKVEENLATPAQVIMGVAPEGYILPHMVVSYGLDENKEIYCVRVIPRK